MDFSFLTFKLEFIFLLYFLVIYGSYYIQSIISSRITYKYSKLDKLSLKDDLLKYKKLPKIALIAPAFNEALVIKDSVRSLLSVHYFNFDLVIVNDGSKDNTMDILIESFDLIENDLPSYSSLESKPVIKTYTSTISAYKNLIVVDKINGRKADAVNAGINYAHAEYYAIIDLDCILEPFALLSLIEPIMKERDKKVVAVGGVIGATNDAVIRHGKFEKERSPNTFLPRMQVIEYFRSFILSRPAWSNYNGLLLISGALGLFEREILLDVEGYSHDAIGEDMDLVMKIHQHCLETYIDYKIDFIPYPLCWTEVPESLSILGSQRNRWMRGTIECMRKFKKMFLNRKFGRVGLISYPYWLVAEMLAPILELIGFVITVYLIVTGLLNFKFAILLFILVYFLSVTLSCIAMTNYHLCFNKYSCQKDYLKFLGTALVEPFIYHPRVLYWSLKGYYDYFFTKNIGWGVMVRKGFSDTAT